MGKVLNALNKSNGVGSKTSAKSPKIDAVSEAVRQATQRAVEKLSEEKPVADKVEKPAIAKQIKPATSSAVKQAVDAVAATEQLAKPQAQAKSAAATTKAPAATHAKAVGKTTIVTAQAKKPRSVKTRITPQIVTPQPKPTATKTSAAPVVEPQETKKPAPKKSVQRAVEQVEKQTAAPAEQKSVSRAVNRSDRLAAIRANRGPVATRHSHYFSPLIITNSKPRCQISEQFRQIRTALIRLANRGPVRCMITSSQPREGKTVTAVNMAYCFSEITKQRTLLIDADLRRGRVADLFGMGRKYGLSELLNGDCTIEEATWSAGRENFHVITAGAGSIEQIGEMLAGEQAEQVMTNLSRMYDNIIIDSPPIISVADPAILCRWVDMSLMAVRIHSTHRKLIEQATQILESVGVHVTGLIALDEKSSQRNYYRYASYG